MGAIADNPGFKRAAEPRTAAPQAGGGFAFTLFLVLNALLFVRPHELFRQLEGLPIYNVVILGCLFAALPQILTYLEPKSLARSPVTLCVFGMLPAIVLSQVARGDLERASFYGQDFAKIATYYLLLVSLVTTPQRVRQLLRAITIYILILSALSVLRYHNFIELDSLSPMVENQFRASSDDPEVIVVRLLGVGIFGNPNDMARLLVVGILLIVFEMSLIRGWFARLIWAPPMVLLAHALQMTYSRGGFLSLIGGLLTLLHQRFGAKRGGILMLLAMPALMIFGGRQTDVGVSSGTGQLRIQLWSEGLVAMRASPVFGIGTDQYAEMAGNHAHNSFVEAFVETGFLGGTCFVGATFLSIAPLYRLRGEPRLANNIPLAQLRPSVLALQMAWVIGQFSSSREYSPLTYVLIGLCCAYQAMAEREAPGSTPRVSGRLLMRVVAVSALTLVGLHLYTKVNAHFS